MEYVDKWIYVYCCVFWCSLRIMGLFLCLSCYSDVSVIHTDYCTSQSHKHLLLSLIRIQCVNYNKMMQLITTIHSFEYSIIWAFKWSESQSRSRSDVHRQVSVSLSVKHYSALSLRWTETRVCVCVWAEHILTVNVGTKQPKPNAVPQAWNHF